MPATMIVTIILEVRSKLFLIMRYHHKNIITFSYEGVCAWQEIMDVFQEATLNWKAVNYLIDHAYALTYH